MRFFKLFYAGVGNLSSVVLLPVLVYSLGLGVTGAALATVASQYVLHRLHFIKCLVQLKSHYQTLKKHTWVHLTCMKSRITEPVAIR